MDDDIYHLLLSSYPDDDAEYYEAMLSDLADYIDSTVVGRAADDGAEADCSDDATRTPADVQEPAECSSSRPSQGVRKLFENSLVVVDDRPDRLEPIAAQLSDKTPDDDAEHDEAMVSYLARIDSGLLGFPDYTDSGMGRAAQDGAEADCSEDAPRTPADVQEPAKGSSCRPSQGVRELSLMVVDDRPDRWEPIAALLPGKTQDDDAEHNEAMVSYLARIDSGLLAIRDSIGSTGVGSAGDDGADTSADVQEPAEGSSSRPAKGVRKPRRTYIPKEERKKPVPWEEMEHRLFLRGMMECVKGDWRGISRFWVRTRTPAQVASHAQKFFKRQNGGGKSKRRSIHDITDPY